MMYRVFLGPLAFATLLLLLACDPQRGAVAERPTSAPQPEPVDPAREPPAGGEYWGEHLVFPVNAAGSGPVMVLLHGYGAPQDDLVPFARWLGQQPGLGDARFFMLGAPLTAGAGGAWWALPSRAERERARAAGDLREGPVPSGLVSAREKVMAFLGELARREEVSVEEITLGGFSQGAMLSVDVALHAEQPPGTVFALSGAIRGQDEWPARFPEGRAPRIFVSHGRGDSLLPFELGEHLRDALRERGAQVSFLAFEGDHTIPPPVRTGLAAFLRVPADIGTIGDLVDDTCGEDDECELERQCCALTWRAVSAEGARMLRHRCMVSSCAAPASTEARPRGARCEAGHCVIVR